MNKAFTQGRKITLRKGLKKGESARREVDRVLKGRARETGWVS